VGKYVFQSRAGHRRQHGACFLHAGYLIRVECMFLTNTTYLFYLMVEVYLHYHLTYNYMFRLLKLAIFRLYMSP